MRFSLIILLGILLQFLGVRAQQASDHDSIVAATDTTSLVYDPPFIRMLDSLVHIKYFSNDPFSTDTAELNIYGFEPGEIPSYPDSVYEQRIAELNAQTPIELTYNKEVRKYIDLYAAKKRELSSRMMGLAHVYFPLFEEMFDQYNIPLEMKYLAIVESALNPTAGSYKGAKGLWQFMYGTAKVYGLKVTSLTDDRYDPYLATKAACEHMNDLYEIYGDWSLVMAAYNSGAGNVNRALRRSGGVKNYWAVWPFLPRETRGYVPAFIAVTYVMNYSVEHNLYPVNPGILYNGTDTVRVKDLLHFDQLYEMLGIPLDDLEYLNPKFKMGIIPATADKPEIIRIPNEYVGLFLNNEDSLYAFKTKKGIEREKLLAEVAKAKNRNIHIVRSGENLGLIAKKYSVYVSQIKAWNGLRSNTIYPGQKLVVYGAGHPSFTQNTTTPVSRSGEKSYHIVQSGENLGLIAKKYQCSTTDLKEWNNLTKSTIYPKQKLIVYKPEETASSSSDGDYLYHTIREGDTLWDIAKLYDGVTVDQIKKLNAISNSRRLKPGQKLKIAKLQS